MVTAVARQQLLHLAERPDESAADGEEGQGQHAHRMRRPVTSSATWTSPA
ncbi:hypothetical protein NQP46_32105 [Streptomyces albus]|nr:hypothetical protein NQP46_32105 [Streptomyces albus]